MNGPNVRILHGDVRAMLKTLPEKSVHCILTSPPYYGLRDFHVPPVVWGENPAKPCQHEWGVEMKVEFEDPGGWGSPGYDRQDGKKGELIKHYDGGTRSLGQYCLKCSEAWLGQLGLEPSPQEYVLNVVEVFTELWRVLRDDGIAWLNLGDSYNTKANTRGSVFRRLPSGRIPPQSGKGKTFEGGIKSKDLLGIPWAVAFALREAGWYLRRDIVWERPNQMPESATDRPHSSHEYVFMLTKRDDYYYDPDAVRQPSSANTHAAPKNPSSGPKTLLNQKESEGGFAVRGRGWADDAKKPYRALTRHLRSVWTIPIRQRPAAHFATFPHDLASIPIRASTSEKGCCSKCGAQVVRMVEKEEPVLSAWSAEGQVQYSPEVNDTVPASKGSTLKHIVPRKTVGWKPSCECEAPLIPCTVLDPFVGSGTTVETARDLGRSAIGIDLNPDYIQLAEASSHAKTPALTGFGGL